MVAFNKIKHVGHSVIQRLNLSATLTIAVPLLKHIFFKSVKKVEHNAVEY